MSIAECLIIEHTITLQVEDAAFRKASGTSQYFKHETRMAALVPEDSVHSGMERASMLLNRGANALADLIRRDAEG